MTCKMQPMDQGVIRSIKAYIDAVEKGMSPPKFTILDAMTILTGACNRVTADTVRNWFKKACIDSEAKQNAVCDADDCVTPKDVIDIDENLLTSNMESLTDEEILSKFRETNDSVEEDFDEEIEILDDAPNPLQAK